MGRVGKGGLGDDLRTFGTRGSRLSLHDLLYLHTLSSLSSFLSLHVFVLFTSKSVFLSHTRHHFKVSHQNIYTF